METIEVKLNENQKELELRTGKALEIEPIKKVTLSGQIESVFNYLKKRANEIDQKKCNILVAIDNYSITLKVNEDFESGSVIDAAVEIDSKFKEFGINTGKAYTTHELADFIKMNRSYFEKPSDAAALVTTLRNFKAKIDKEVENADDKRGNKNLLVRQIVDSNIPASFNVCLPIFKGKLKQTIEVEINIDANNFNCSLISAHAKEIEQTTVNDLITTQVDLIANLCPDIVIIYS